MICSDTIFPLFLVCSADFDMLLSGLFSHHDKFYSSTYIARIRFPPAWFGYGKLPWFDLRMDSTNDIHVLTRAVTKGQRLGISPSYYMYSV